MKKNNSEEKFNGMEMNSPNVLPLEIEQQRFIPKNNHSQEQTKSRQSAGDFSTDDLSTGHYKPTASLSPTENKTAPANTHHSSLTNPELDSVSRIDENKEPEGVSKNNSSGSERLSEEFEIELLKAMKSNIKQIMKYLFYKKHPLIRLIKFVDYKWCKMNYNIHKISLMNELNFLQQIQEEKKDE